MDETCGGTFDVKATSLFLVSFWHISTETRVELNNGSKVPGNRQLKPLRVSYCFRIVSEYFTPILGHYKPNSSSCRWVGWFTRFGRLVCLYARYFLCYCFRRLDKLLSTYLRSRATICTSTCRRKRSSRLSRIYKIRTKNISKLS